MVASEDDSQNRGEIVPTPIIMLLILISILVYRRVQNGSMQFTVKKFIWSLIITIVFINVIMYFIL